MFSKKSGKYVWFFITAVCLCELAGCTPNVEEGQDWVVSVGDKLLTYEELRSVVPLGLSVEDSAMVADSYINRWIKDQAVILKAEFNLPADRKDFEKQLSIYRNSLLVYAFEKELIKQKLDSVVSELELKTYYDEHLRNFELVDYILRVNYIKLPKDAPKLNQVEKWLNSDKDVDYFELANYCNQFATTSFFDNERWLYLDELLKEIPIQISDKEKFLRENQYIKLNEGEYIYLIKILEYQFKDSTSPLELVRSDIRNIIINKRKKDFITKMRQDLMDEAILNDEVKYNVK